MPNKNRRLSYYLTALLAFILASPANAELYLMFNVGDTEDRAVPDAGTTLPEALDGNPPASIDSNAERYFVPLPDASMQTLSGSATPVGSAANSSSIASAASATGAAVQSMSESTMSDSSTGSASPDECGSGWVEYEAFAASLMYFSPDGLDEESDVRFEPARVFLRCLEDGSIVAMITGQNGAPPTD